MTTTAAPVPTFRPIHPGWLALCLDAVDTYDTEHRLDALTSGAYQVAWTGPGFARGYDNRPASELIQCLAHQAWAYAVAGLTLLASSLVLATRTDGTEYRMLREDCPMHDDLQSLVLRPAHNGELPNDWRYDMVYTLAHALLEYSEPSPKAWTLEDFQDVVGDIAELQVDTSTYALLTWLADNVSRCHFDDVDAWVGNADGSDIGDLAQRRQREAIDTMANVILQGLGALVSA